MRIVPWLGAGALALAAGCASTDTSSSTGAATAPHPAAAATTGNASGTIQNYTTGPSGQQNGFVMATGQRVHFPEEMATKVSDQFPPNTQVTVQGHTITDADGRSVIEADKITAPDRNVTLDLTAARAAPPSGTAPSIGGSGTAGSPPAETQPGTPATPPAGTQPGAPVTPPPAGR